MNRVGQLEFEMMPPTTYSSQSEKITTFYVSDREVPEEMS
jgi:hypothetical protein